MLSTFHDGRVPDRRWPVISKYIHKLALGLLCSLQPFISAQALPLSPGDRLLLVSPYDEDLDGTYQINIDGTILLPFLKPINIQGFEPSQAERIIQQELVKQQYFNEEFSDISLQVQLWASVNVFVSGEVFNPGRVTINAKPDTIADDDTPQKTGDESSERFLTAALRNAGGITPFSDLTQIRVVSQGRTSLHNVVGVFTGEPFDDVPLLEGDQVIVPRAEQPLADITRPSQVSPLGVKVFIANLAEYVRTQAAVSTSKEATGLPYGARLVHAITSGNCLGGGVIDKGKYVVHGRASRATGQVEWNKFRVESVLKQSTAANGATNNPVLFNNDVVVCYASDGTSLKDVGTAISEIFSPVFLYSVFK